MSLPAFQITTPRARDLILRVLLLCLLALSVAYVAAEPKGKDSVLPRHVANKYIDSLGERLLIDPQRLLTSEDYGDVEGSLLEHAKHSQFDLSLLLLAGEQSLANAESFEDEIRARLLASRSEGASKAGSSPSPRWAGVIIYYLGTPARSSLILVDDELGVDAVVGEEQTEDLTREKFSHNKLVNTARRKASEKSSDMAQLNAFLTQLSISLFWLEEEQQQAENVSESPEVIVVESEITTHVPQKKSLLEEIVQFLNKYLVFIILTPLLGLLIAFILYKSKSDKIYLLDEGALPERLQAKYAAGVGATIGFDDHHVSPSNQRDSKVCFLSES